MPTAANIANSSLVSLEQTLKADIAKLKNEFVLKVADAMVRELEAYIESQDMPLETKKSALRTAEDLKQRLINGDHMLHGQIKQINEELTDTLNTIVEHLIQGLKAWLIAYDNACMIGHKSVTGAPGAVIPIIVT